VGGEGRKVDAQQHEEKRELDGFTGRGAKSDRRAALNPRPTNYQVFLRNAAGKKETEHSGGS